MEKLKYYIEKYRVLLIILLMLILLIISIIYSFKDKQQIKKEEVETSFLTESPNIKKEIENDKEIFIDIKGYVVNPGVYKMKETSRVIDAINKAGGLKENANTEYLNLSKKLLDEMVIIVYSNEETEKFKIEKDNIIYIKAECECPDNINDACLTNNDVVNTITDNKTVNEDENDSELISINTDSIEELMKLSGIGKSKAESIIDYRKENGNFKMLEDIMKVSGIGESAYQKIKDNIKL